MPLWKSSKNKSIHVVYVDLKKAYNSIPRNILWVAMRELGIPRLLITTVQNLYKNDKIGFVIGLQLTDDFKTSKPRMFPINVRGVFNIIFIKVNGLGSLIF